MSNIFELYQNTALSAIMLHTFSLEYYNVAKHRNKEFVFPKLEHMFYVLPLVYNEEARETFIKARLLHNVLLNNTLFVIDLSEKANKMSAQTFDALNLAMTKKILFFNQCGGTIDVYPQFLNKRIGVTKSYTILTEMQKCAVRLGVIFAKTDDKNLQTTLNIRF